MTMAPPTASEPSADKRRYVREMFSAIAPRYDFLNHLLSLNIDRSWRRRAVGWLGWEARPEGLYLDACAGTLDFAAELAARPAFRGTVIGADFAVPMLRFGASKSPKGMVRPAAGDVLELPFRDATFDGAMVAFGIRNLVDLKAGFSELWRVLKPAGRLVVLDFTTPPFAPLRVLYLLYFRRVLPLLGRAVSGHPTAYAYLPSSVVEFPVPQDLARLLEQVGFSDCGYRLMTGGVAAVHWGTR